MCPFVNPIVSTLANKFSGNQPVQRVAEKAQPAIRAAQTAQNHPVVKNLANKVDVIQAGVGTMEQKAAIVRTAGNVVQKFHGNDLRSTAQTWGYKLVDKSSGVVKKIGESMHPETRYAQKYLDVNNLEMVRGPSGSKLDIRIWEHEQIGEYIFTHGGAHPVLNYQAERAVNVFR